MSIRTSALFQTLLTLLKVGIIVAIIIAGLFLPAPANNAISAGKSFSGEMSTMAFAVGLIYVSYAYSGWNATAYIAREFKDPARLLPVTLIGGTILVTVLYTLLQFVFLKHASVHEMQGQLNVGTIVIEKMLGPGVSRWSGLVISILLVSGISAMVWIGPRVTAGMAQEHRLWHRFRTGNSSIPVKALWLQFAVSALMVISGSFEQILVYCGFLLTLSSFLVVAGAVVIRIKKKSGHADSYRSPLFPFFQVLFLALSLWMILFAIFHKPVETMAGIANLFVGLITYFWSRSLALPKSREPGRE